MTMMMMMMMMMTTTTTTTTTTTIIIIIISARRHMAVMIALAFCTCLSFCGIFITKYDTGTFFDPDTNTTIYRRLLTPFYLANKEAIEFVFQTFNLVVPATTSIVVILATSVIAVRMRSVTAWREQNASVSCVLHVDVAFHS